MFSKSANQANGDADSISHLDPPAEWDGLRPAMIRFFMAEVNFLLPWHAMAILFRFLSDHMNDICLHMMFTYV